MSGSSLKQRKYFSTVFLFVVLTGCAAQSPLHTLKNREVSTYTLEVGWAPSYHRTDNGLSTDNPFQKTQRFYLWAFRAAIPRDLQGAGDIPDDWRERGCLLYGPVRYSALGLPPLMEKELLQSLPGETPETLKWDYHIRAACLGFPANTFFQETLVTYRAFTASKAAAVVIRHAGETVQRADLQREMAEAFGVGRQDAVRFRCGTDRVTGKPDLERLYIGIKARRLASFPRGVSLAGEPFVKDACPEEFVIPAFDEAISGH